MIEPGRRESMRRATTEALARFGRLEEELNRRRDQPAEPGDLWVFPQTADLPLEWLVLERHPTDSRRVLVVPADTNPVSGPADVAVPKTAPCGPLRLRCGYGTWVDSPEGGRARRTGLVEAEVVQQARERYAALKAEPGGGEPETVDPEYEDWVDDVVRRGTRALTVAGGRPPVQKSWVARPWATAATVLLALGLGWATGRMIPRASVPDPALQDARDRLARQEAELQRLRTEGPAKRGDPGPLPASPAASKEAAPRPLTNLPFIWLGPSEATRGPAPVLTVPPAAALVLIVLQVDDPEPRRRYRLDVHGGRTGQKVWSGGGLVKTGVSELALALPRELLPAGAYSLRLYDEEAPRAVHTEYAFRIDQARPASPRPSH
jgi:hypothetical protein